MAAPTTQKRPRRSKDLLPTCYYENYLEKRSPKETTSSRLWTCLCGNTLFFYHTSKDSHYAEKLELSGFVSLADDNSRVSNLEAARFNLRMKSGEFKFTASSLETRELWKGFILSVVELTVPRSLNLLPGQLHMMAEVIKKEKERLRASPLPPPLPQAPVPSLHLPLLDEMPPCYHSVSRLEAEILLERQPEFGNFLLRPGRDGCSMAITTYQDLNGPFFKHYRVTRKLDGGFSIDVENPIPCATLHDVINFLVERTSRTLRPFILEESYDKRITFFESNDENGEKSLQCASVRPNLTAPVRPPKAAFFESNDENGEKSLQCASVRPNLTAPVRPPKPGCNPARVSCSLEDDWKVGIYVDYSSDGEDERSVAHPPSPPPRTVRKALLPQLPSSSPYEGENSGTSGDPEDENPTTLPPQRVKKALLPRLRSSTTYEGENNSTLADNQVLGYPVPPPRSAKPTNLCTEAPIKMRRRSLPPNVADQLAAAIANELKEKLELRRPKQ